jgi:hypothetical protein
MMSTRLWLGILIGAVAMWVWCNREDLTALVTNREKVSGAGKVWSGLKEIGIF